MNCNIKLKCYKEKVINIGTYFKLTYFFFSLFSSYILSQLLILYIFGLDLFQMIILILDI